MMASVSRSLHQLGVPFAVRWTHIESTCASSVLTFTLGHCFHFQASLDGGCGVMVTALPGLHNHADQRSLTLGSADDLRQFFLGEACRQIVLTFGDMAAAVLSDKDEMYFRIDLVPPAINLWKEKLVKSSRDREDPDFEEKGRGSGWEIRVCPREVSSLYYTNRALLLKCQTCPYSPHRKGFADFICSKFPTLVLASSPFLREPQFPCSARFVLGSSAYFRWEFCRKHRVLFKCLEKVKTSALWPD